MKDRVPDSTHSFMPPSRDDDSATPPGLGDSTGVPLTVDFVPERRQEITVTEAGPGHRPPDSQASIEQIREAVPGGAGGWGSSTRRDNSI